MGNQFVLRVLVLDGHGAARPSLALCVLGGPAHSCQQDPGAQGDSSSWTSFWNSSRCS